MNRVEAVLNQPAGVVLAPLEVALPNLPVTCLLTGIIRAIAGQANYATRRQFAARRAADYRALARAVAGGYLPPTGAAFVPAGESLSGRSSEQLIARLGALA